MKIHLILIFLALVLISACTPTGQIIKEEPLILEGPYLVTAVVDGDTLDINNSERIRLSGINTPETGECYYQEAKNKLKELTYNKEVYLEKDRSNKDKYDRLLRYIYLNESYLVNEILVQNGYARVYDKYSYDTKRYDQLKEVEAKAIEKGIGIWSCKDPKENCLYVGSKNSDKYYPPDCKWAKRIKPENLICFKSEEEVKNRTLGKNC